MYKQEFQNLIGACADKFALKGKRVPSYSTYEDYDYQSSILFSLNKHPDKDAITQQVVNFIKDSGNYEKVTLTGGGYISVKVKVKAFEDEFVPENKTVVIDYCGANVAKKMHIGHIRSMFIGDYVARLHEAKGNDVHRFNHIGDWGNQFGFLLEYIIQNNIVVKDNQELTNVYRQASALNKDDEGFRKLAEDRAYALQQNDEETVALWKKCCALSLTEMSATFKQFDLLMTEDDAMGESFYAPLCPFVEKMLVEAGVAVVSEDGSVIVPDENPNKSPLVIKKSTGSYLYAMYDLAAIFHRVNIIKPNEIIYVVDKRQDLHFKQVFAVANKMGWDKGCKLIHIGFGTILGEDKKPLKTRSGEVLYLDDLLDDGWKEMESYSAIEKIENSSYKKLVTEKTLFGALKFYDLHFATNTDYLFSWESVLSLKGNSAPYIQNAAVRIDSILFKIFGDVTPETKAFDVNIVKSFEGDLANNMLTLYMKNQITNEVMLSLEANDSQVLTEELMKMCKQFHIFYEGNNISYMKDSEQEMAVSLIKEVYKTLEIGSNILGIFLYPCEKRATQLK